MTALLSPLSNARAQLSPPELFNWTMNPPPMVGRVVIPRPGSKSTEFPYVPPTSMLPLLSSATAITPDGNSVRLNVCRKTCGFPVPTEGSSIGLFLGARENV
jgi:hypothetical protein